MLKEIRAIADKNSRWFSDDYFDLIVWYDEQGRADGFQLCYDKEGDERAFTWRKDQPPTHERIDSGEESPLKNRAPILVPDGLVSYADLIGRFRERAATIEPELFDLVLRKLSEGIDAHVRDMLR